MAAAPRARDLLGFVGVAVLLVGLLGWPAGAAPTMAAPTSDDACDSAAIEGTGFDQYGGWRGITRPATGRFATGQVDGRWWLFTPEGNAYYANGSSGIETWGDTIQGTARSPYNEAVLARHGSEAAWAEVTLQRLCGLGMHVLGGWVSTTDVARFAGRMPYVGGLNIYAAMPEVPTGPESYNSRRRDVFVPDAAARASAAAAGSDMGVQCATDPWCVGLYVENEVPYAPSLTAGGGHFDVYLSQPAGSPGKVALQQFLEDRYAGDLAAFNLTWDTSLAAWADVQSIFGLGDCPTDIGLADDLCVLHGPPQRRDDRLGFEASVAGRTATLADDALAGLNPTMLNLGPRLVMASYLPDLVKAINAPVDVASVNNYDVTEAVALLATDEDLAAIAELGALSFDPFERLDQLAAMTDKPIIVSEWFYRLARPDQPSFPPILPERPDPTSRAAAVCTYLERLHTNPAVVGEHWFQWQDQPIEGRFDGENQLIGLVNIDDEANPALTEVMTTMNEALIERRLGVSGASPCDVVEPPTGPTATAGTAPAPTSAAVTPTFTG